MVVLAQALVSQPKFLLIDELSLGLAPVVVNRLIPVSARWRLGRRRAAHRAVRHGGARPGDRAYVMEGGVIRYSGTAAELRDKPDMLQSAYLLRGSASAGGGAPAPADGSSPTRQ